MSISPILGVAIGVVFVYALLSLMCTAAKELLEGLLKKRASDLEAGIRELLNDPKGENLAKDVFEHPLIFGLFKGGYVPVVGSFSTMPSYIPARNFAQALADVVLRPQRVPDYQAPAPAQANVPVGGALSQAVVAEQPKTVTWATATAVTTTPIAAPPPLIPMPMPNLAAVAGAPPAAVTPQSIMPDAKPTPLHELINKLPDTQVRRALLTFADSAANDEKHLRESIEAWFNSAMDRVSGGYKRHAQYFLFLLGLVVTVVLNVDTIAICNSLSHDPEQVKTILEAADKFTKSSTPSTKSTSTQSTKSDAPANTTPTAVRSANTTSTRSTKLSDDGKNADTKVPSAVADTSTAAERWKQELNQLESFGLPIGWHKDTIPNCPDFWGWLLRKFFGLLLTTLAISLGAPFWFDVLNKLMIVRSTVKPHEKSQEEKGKDAGGK